jgi:hypothetical protein
LQTVQTLFNEQQHAEAILRGTAITSCTSVFKAEASCIPTHVSRHRTAVVIPVLAVFNNRSDRFES